LKFEHQLMTVVIYLLFLTCRNQIYTEEYQVLAFLETEKRNKTRQNQESTPSAIHQSRFLTPSILSIFGRVKVMIVIFYAVQKMERFSETCLHLMSVTTAATSLGGQAFIRIYSH
jgi:hypothetical protein